MFKHTLIAAALLAAGSAHALTVTQWNFNSTVADANTATGVNTPSIGAGSVSLIGGVTSLFASGDASGGSSDPAAGDDSGLQTTSYKAQSTGDKSAGVEFKVSTLGYKNIVFSYDLRHSNTSSRYEQLQYSLNGSTFVDAFVFDGNKGDTWFNSRSFDLSAIAGANNNANLSFRVLATFAPGSSAYATSNPSAASYGSTGTWRFDMATVSGVTAVPEPESYAMLLAGLCMLGLIARRSA